MACNIVGKICLLYIVLIMMYVHSRSRVPDVTEFLTEIQFCWIREIEIERSECDEGKAQSFGNFLGIFRMTWTDHRPSDIIPSAWVILYLQFVNHIEHNGYRTNNVNSMPQTIVSLGTVPNEAKEIL
jgi:hypothetical protein